MRTGIARPVIFSTDQILDQVVQTEDIADGAVTEEKLSSTPPAVSTSKIQNDAVTEEKLSSTPPAVSTSKIQNDAVTEAKIAGKSVSYAKMTDTLRVYIFTVGI
jgi:hypothetical protein